MKPLNIVIVGAGNRAMIYARHAERHPEEMKIVGVVDPNPIRRKRAQDKFGFGNEMCFDSVEKFCEKGKIADAVINGTMDELHVSTSKPLLKCGYDILLEKPFATNETEMNDLLNEAQKYGRKVMICHVLRYTPFYSAIKQAILDGEVGDILNIQMAEHVNYNHMAVSYVRGKWASEKECHAPMLLAKSCHDIDLMMWMMDGANPISISSFGSEFIFDHQKKPQKAGTRCMVDCPIESECPYSARRHYLIPPYRWKQYVWTALEGTDATLEDKAKSLKNDNPYGRCVWDCQRDGNVDHQSVMINFDNGATGTFNMIGGTTCSERKIHIIGTKGEIVGVFEDSIYSIRKFLPEEESGYVEQTFDLKIQGDMIGAFGGHGGGDRLIPGDFVRYVNGEKTSISCTALERSVIGHLVVFKAEQARKENKIITI